jgi:hypothetical protein
VKNEVVVIARSADTSMEIIRNLGRVHDMLQDVQQEAKHDVTV